MRHTRNCLRKIFRLEGFKIVDPLADPDDIDRKLVLGSNGNEDAAPRYRWSVRDSFSYDGFAPA